MFSHFFFQTIGFLAEFSHTTFHWCIGSDIGIVVKCVNDRLAPHGISLPSTSSSSSLKDRVQVIEGREKNYH